MTYTVPDHPFLQLQLPLIAPAVAVCTDARGFITTVGCASGAPVAGGSIELTSYGVAGVGGNDTVVFNLAVDASNAQKKPLHMPSGSYSLDSTRHPVNVGIYGDGSAVTTITAIGNFNGSSIVDLCSNGNTSCPEVFISGITVVGNGTRPATRSANPADIGNTASCVKLDTYAYNPFVNDVGTRGCLYGINNSNYNGTVNIDRWRAGDNWYGFYNYADSGDVHITDSNLDGTMFANIAAPGTANVYHGGFNGLFVTNTHLGFSPYGVYVENGTGNIGIYGAIFNNSPFESTGNEMIHLPLVTGGGDFRYTQKITFIGASGSWTSDPNLAILGDSNNPVHDYAISQIDSVSGGAEVDGPIQFVGGDLPTGTSGFIGLVNNLSFSGQLLSGRPDLWNVINGKQYLTATSTSSTTASCGVYYNSQFNLASSCLGQTVPADVVIVTSSLGDNHLIENQWQSNSSNAVAIGVTGNGYSGGQLSNGQAYVRSTNGHLHILAGNDYSEVFVGVGSNLGGDTFHGFAVSKTAGVSTDPWTFLSGLIANGAAPSTTAGQVAFGGTTAAASNCNNSGSLTGVVGCLVVNVAGTTHYTPYF